MKKGPTLLASAIRKMEEEALICDIVIHGLSVLDMQSIVQVLQMALANIMQKSK